MPDISQATVAELLEMAIAELDNLRNNEDFVVHDLFKEWQWKLIKGKKSKLGKQFYDYALTDSRLAMRSGREIRGGVANQAYVISVDCGDQNINALGKDELRQRVADEIRQLPQGMEFTVPDLFRPYEWGNRVSQKNKGALGGWVSLHYCQGEGQALIEKLGKKLGHIHYKKK